MFPGFSGRGMFPGFSGKGMLPGFLLESLPDPEVSPRLEDPCPGSPSLISTGIS